MAHNKTILVIHQSAELYGSDKSLLSLMHALAVSEYKLIVCLPTDGPLADELRAATIEVHVLPLLKVGRRTLANLWKVWRLSGLVSESIRRLDNVVNGRKIDIVYTNTVAVMAGAFWAKRHNIPHVWHVREIISKPRSVSLAFIFLTRYFSSKLICNSQNTRSWIDPGNGKRSITIWNGVETIEYSLRDPIQRLNAKQKFGIDKDEIVILMAGRVNSWKGQDLLIETLEKLPVEKRALLRLILVGSCAPGQTHFTENLQRIISHSTIRDQIIFHEFNRDLDEYYLAADILIVPSKLPEPFGRVAIEGMSFSLPVIAAHHGGLSEIVEDQRTGLLFEPNNQEELCEAVLALLSDPSKREQLGKAGQVRQSKLFSVETYVQKIKDIFDETVRYG